MPQPKARLTFSRACVLASGLPWLLPILVGCGSADPNMFGAGLVQLGGSSSSSGASSAGSSGMAPAVSGGGSESVAGGTNSAGSAGSGGSSSACAFTCGDGGRGGSIGLGGGGAGGANEAGSSSGSPECAAIAADAMYLPSTQHCYLVDTEQRTFAAAQAHCKTLDAHLVTLSDLAENDFAWGIHPDEHWIGSQDGRAATKSGAGTYTWLTNEPFDYTNWSHDQPNASRTDCDGGGDCYEHCAFQWKGGDHDNQWNDRYCAHTIASICEWDKVPVP